MDDNGRLLASAVGGVSRAALSDAGVTHSQLALLEAMDLIALEGNTVRTAFPVLGPDLIVPLRRQLTDEVADRIAAVEVDARRLGDVLTRSGHARNLSAVLFGHALDGRTWDHLGARGALPQVELSVDRPWWSGAFWAVYPPRDAAAGTNFVRTDGAELVLVWRPETVRQLGGLAAAEGTREWLATIARGGGPTGPSTIVDADGRRWELTSAHGRPAVPVIDVDDEVDVLACRIGETVAGLCDRFVALGRQVPTDDPRVATVVLAHELIWTIMDALVERGVVEPPTGGVPDGAGLRDLYVLRSEPGRGSATRNQ